jgi:hypothetical protein
MASNAISAERVSYPEACSRSIKVCWTTSRPLGVPDLAAIVAEFLDVPGYHHSPPHSLLFK